MERITHYGVFICLLFSIASEWKDISQVKPAAIFCLLAAFFYLLFLFYTLTENHFPDRMISRKTRYLEKRRARRNARAGLIFTLLFLFFWIPFSPSIQILSIGYSFFLLLFHLLSLSFEHRQGKIKEDLGKNKVKT